MGGIGHRERCQSASGADAARATGTAEVMAMRSRSTEKEEQPTRVDRGAQERENQEKDGAWERRMSNPPEWTGVPEDQEKKWGLGEKEEQPTRVDRGSQRAGRLGERRGLGV